MQIGSGATARINRDFLIVSSIIAVLIGLFAGAIQAAPATQPASTASGAVQSEIDQLKARLDVLEAEKNGGELPATNPAPTSSEKPSFFENLALATGYDPNVGFVIRSENGDFSFHPGILVDIRNMTSYREALAPNNGSEVPGPRYDTQNGFDITRFRMTFDGNFTKNVTYFIQLQDDQGTTFGLLDAYAVYHFSPVWAVKAGQFKDPVWHERNISEINLMAVDRSLLEFLVGGGQTARVQGVSLMYDQDRLRAQLAVTDGFNSGNTKFFNGGGIGAGAGAGAGVSPTDYGISTREEWLAMGDRTAQFNPYTEYDRGFTAMGDTQNILVFGAGADYSEAGANDVIFHTVDAQYDNTCGFSAYAAYLGSYRRLLRNEGVAPGFYYVPGFMVQAAYLVTPKIEPFIRYDYMYLPPASETNVTTGQVEEFTIGANYYIYKQNVKFTLDASWLPQGSPADADALGILKNSGQNEFTLRAQLQLSI